MSTKIVTGLPTEPDVAKLIEVFGTPPEGTRISWDEIEAAINTPRNTARFRTVVTSWRRKLEKTHHILLRCVHGIGLESCTPDARIEAASDNLRSGFRKIRRAVNVAEFTDRTRLSNEHRRAADHVLALGASIKLAAATAAKALPPIHQQQEASQ